MAITKYKDWTIIPWDGNLALGFKCYRKSFGRGFVSIGIGEFDLIVYSYGNNCEDSMSSTRWRENGWISEKNAMALVDKMNGKYV